MSKFGLLKALELLNSNNSDESDTEINETNEADDTLNIPKGSTLSEDDHLSVESSVNATGQSDYYTLQCLSQSTTNSREIQQQVPTVDNISPVVVYIEEQISSSFEDVVAPVIETSHDNTSLMHTPSNNLANVLIDEQTTSFTSSPLIQESNENTNNVLPDTNIAELVSPKRGRKRVKDESQWKQAMRKRRRQSGQEYVNCRGNSCRARELKTVKDCEGKCKYKCASHFTAPERKDAFDNFWQLNDTEKNTFYAQTTDKFVKATKRTKKAQSRRQNTMQYYLVKGIDRIRVCKQFYLSTLDISAKRIEYFYKRQERDDMNFVDRRGGHTKKRIPEIELKRIRDHVNMFPRIPSHYCRASTTKEYLESNLTITKMYRMYVDMTLCSSEGVQPQNEWTYRKVIVQDFNIGFFKPKKDRCDTCEEYRAVETINIPPILRTKYDDHIADKQHTREERDSDRDHSAEAQSDSVLTTICFDMEKVQLCPRANVSNFFYKRKLSVYNLTAHCATNKIAYNAIWSEAMAGRGANEIASALMIILEQVVTSLPHIRKIILWSDSCVPQNKNSILSSALRLFLQNHTHLVSIEQKYCTPGHSSIQEVDNIHSHIEKHLSKVDIFSPLSLVRHMKDVRRDVMEIHQMKPNEFKDFHEVSMKFYFKNVPYNRVKSLTYLSIYPYHMYYKLSFAKDCPTIVACLKRQTRSSENPNWIDARTITKVPHVCELKKKDIESMLKFMPLGDRTFMEMLLKIGTQRRIST